MRNGVNIVTRAMTPIKNGFSSLILMFWIATIAPQIAIINQIMPVVMGAIAPIAENIIMPMKKIVAKSYLDFAIK